MPDTQTMLVPTLTDDQVAQYRADGYTLYKKPVFPDDKFAKLSSIFEDDLARYGPEDLDVIHFHDKRLMEFLLADEVLDLVEPLIGPNIGLWSSHFISKPPRTGKATPWHEDSSYWKGRISSMDGIVTVWLAMDIVTPENGCMRVVPGSHLGGGFSEYDEIATGYEENIFPTEVKSGTFDDSKAVYFSLMPNECSLHDARIIHGAKANTSDTRRAGYTMRYFATSSKVFPEKNSYHKIWLARGRDIAGNQYED